MITMKDKIGYSMYVCNINIVAQFVSFLIISRSKLVSIHIWLKIKSMVLSKVILGLQLLLYTQEILLYIIKHIPTNTKCIAF